MGISDIISSLDKAIKHLKAAENEFSQTHEPSARKYTGPITSKDGYDLDTIEGIALIDEPTKNDLYSNGIVGVASPVNNIEYILQRKATEHKRNGKIDLAIACLRKSNELMPRSDIIFSRSDYMRVVDYLRYDKRYSEATEERKFILKNYEKYFSETQLKDIRYNAITKLESQLNDCDLFVTSGSEAGMCGECAALNCRMFSFYGRDKRFPKFPEYAKDRSKHIYCGISFWPQYYYGNDRELESSRGHNYGKILTASHRPFIDPRTEEEKAIFERDIKKWTTEEKDRNTYDLLMDIIPEISPKTFGAFRRMKNANTKSFIFLKEKASEYGIEIE